jgi:hypothetical protein
MNHPDLVGASKRALEIQARMLFKAKVATLSRGSFLSPVEISHLIGCSKAQLNGWQHDGRIFAIEDGGNVYFPLYAFSQGETHPSLTVSTVLKIFGDTKSGWVVALWFAAANSFLNDERPQDVLATDPQRVVAAAKNEVEGLHHG